MRRTRRHKDKTIMRKRALIVGVFASLIFVYLVSRLIFLMVFQSNHLKSLAVEQWSNEIKIDAKRGRILDRNGHELAVSANVYRVDLDMNEIRKTYIETTDSKQKTTYEDLATKLSKALNMEYDKVLKELTATLPSGRPRGSAILARRVEKNIQDAVKALNISGVILSADTKRYYPNSSFLAHVLGTTNTDSKGLTGIELQYDTILSGTPGMRIAELDKLQNDLPYNISYFTEPVNGKDVVLTIDEKVQYFAEKAAEQVKNDNKAKAATVMVMDPKTGEILALANAPDFDPNASKDGKSYDELQSMWRNRAINDSYEPGSIAKVLTSAAALEEGILHDNDTFVCTGSKVVAGRVIKCWNTAGHGKQDAAQILQNSCNVGYMELGERLGVEKLTKHLDLFGIGHKTGVDLPGESSGVVRDAKNYSVVDLATTAFGQGNAMSAIQYMAAFNSVANKGMWVTPHIMKEIKSDDNSTVAFKDYSKNYTEKSVISEATASKLLEQLESVVLKGGSSKAHIEGYRIGGKTGTAQKVNPQTGGYDPGKYISTFVGVAPIEDPRFTVFVSIDEPDPANYYAGQIAAPVGQRIFNDLFNYYGIKPNTDLEKVANSLKNDVVVPEVRGKSKEEAQKMLKELKLDVEIQGTGTTVTDINPKPGYTIKEGSKVIVQTSGQNTEDVVVPDLKGYTQDKANAILTNIGLKPTFTGKGLVTTQTLPKGKVVAKGTAIQLVLDTVGGD